MHAHSKSVLIFLVLLTLAACSTAPPPPLMSPLSEARRYGYSERQIGPERYKVTYSGPAAHTASNRAAREEDSTAAKAQSYDFALWRAAQLALDNGYQGFRVEQDDDEVEVTVRQGYYPYYPPYYPRYGGFYRAPYPYFGPPGYYSYGSYRETTLKAITTLIVAMEEKDGPNVFDAAATAGRLAAKYPTASGRPANSATPSNTPSGSGY